MEDQVIEKMTPLDDAIAFDKVASDPALNGYSSLKAIHPIVRGYINLHEKRAPLWVRVFFLLQGFVPTGYTKDM